MPKRRGSQKREVVAVVEAQPDALVAGAGRRVDEQRAGHPQVHEQEHLVLEIPDEVLAAPVQALDAPALDGAPAARRARAARTTARRRSRSSRERAALDERRELAADRLDLGKLGHGRAGAYPRRVASLSEGCTELATGAQTNARPADRPRRRPSATGARRADVGERAVVPAARRGRLHDRQQRRVLARVVGARRARVARRGRRSTISRSSRAQLRQPAPRPLRRSRAAPRGSPRRPCGARRPGRSRSGS